MFEVGNIDQGIKEVFMEEIELVKKEKKWKRNQNLKQKLKAISSLMAKIVNIRRSLVSPKIE
jgi:hypothetical protein